jgi:NAD(P)-dependent dehydrogenase (short-subunit alcohol dehydrogenase family)
MGVNSSSKSALHGLIHWLANTYAKHGITVNGVAPALIADTKMLPGSNEELSKSKLAFASMLFRSIPTDVLIDMM